MSSDPFAFEFSYDLAQFSRMKITETTLSRASLFEKEMRQIRITEVTKKDFSDLYIQLTNAFSPYARRNCKLQVYVNGTLCSFETKRQLWQFINGFYLAMELNGFSWNAPILVALPDAL